jgi:hypothetical protein
MSLLLPSTLILPVTRGYDDIDLGAAIDNTKPE